MLYHCRLRHCRFCTARLCFPPLDGALPLKKSALTRNKLWCTFSENVNETKKLWYVEDFNVLYGHFKINSDPSVTYICYLFTDSWYIYIYKQSISLLLCFHPYRLGGVWGQTGLIQTKRFCHWKYLHFVYFWVEIACGGFFLTAWWIGCLYLFTQMGAACCSACVTTTKHLQKNERKNKEIMGTKKWMPASVKSFHCPESACQPFWVKLPMFFAICNVILRGGYLLLLC